MRTPHPLDRHDFATVIRLAPLASIDIVFRDNDHRVLLGLRNNEPAKGFYFVPGGRIWKNERLSDAFFRIVASELNCKANIGQARLLGCFEHFYPRNWFDDPNYGTHYVVLAYEFHPSDVTGVKVDSQHSEYVWMYESELLASERVHENTKAYFRASTRR